QSRSGCIVIHFNEILLRGFFSRPVGPLVDRPGDVMSLHLIIGNKNYSSWSFRPWLAMKVAGIQFDETVISLNAADFKPRLTALGGSGRVPVLSDGAVRVWESLAILEYLAEKFPSARLWPDQPAARAHARAIASEMHAGFVSLRRHLPMNVARPVKVRALD